MAQVVKVQIAGENLFEEEFAVSSVKVAVQMAKARYPMAAKVWWAREGQAGTSAVAPCSNYSDYTTDAEQGPVGGGSSESNHTSDNSSSFDFAGAGFVGLLVGGVVVVGTAVLAFPAIVGGFSAKAATKLASAANLNTAAALAVGAATFAGGTYGGWVAQKQVMPEVAQAQVEIVQEIQQATHEHIVVPMLDQFN